MPSAAPPQRAEAADCPLLGPRRVLPSSRGGWLTPPTLSLGQASSNVWSGCDSLDPVWANSAGPSQPQSSPWDELSLHGRCQHPASPLPCPVSLILLQAFSGVPQPTHTPLCLQLLPGSQCEAFIHGHSRGLRGRAEGGWESLLIDWFSASPTSGSDPCRLCCVSGHFTFC